MASWDDEEFEPSADRDTQFVVTDKWDGEDEDDDIADNWDDDDDEENKEKKGSVPASQPKKKKPLAERIKEREEKKRQEKLAKEEERKRLEEENTKLTPEEQLAEKLRQQRLQEESDLELAKEAFGITDTIPGLKTIDNFHPTSKEEFTELSQMITQKFQKFEGESEFPGFLETLFRDCCTSLESEDIKRISTALNVLATEKQKLNKPKAGKKKGGSKTKNTLTAGKGSTKTEMENFDNFYDEYEDFM